MDGVACTEMDSGRIVKSSHSMLHSDAVLRDKKEIALALFMRDMGMTQFEAEEYISFAFEKAFRKYKAGKVSTEYALVNYMVITAKRRYWSESKKRKRFLPDDEIPEHSVEPHIYQIFEQRERQRKYDRRMKKIMDAIGRMKGNEKQIILKMFQNPEITNRELSVEMGLSDGAIRLYKHRAIKELRYQYENPPESFFKAKADMKINADIELDKFLQMRELYNRGMIGIEELSSQQKKAENAIRQSTQMETSQ